MNRPSLRAVARRLHLRAAVERGADAGRLLIDSLSDPVYQPVAELGRRYVSADRAAGTASRWAAIESQLDQLTPATALDIGCNAGWFTLALGRRGIAALGVEGHPPYYRAAIVAAQRSGLRNVGIVTLELTPETLELLPTVDCTVFLSIWHHIVRDGGLEHATSFVRSVWAHTQQVLFFETGESDEFAGAGFGLPEMVPDARQWLTSYLADTCADAEIVQLGVHPSGPGSEAVRNLFAVRRLA